MRRLISLLIVTGAVLAVAQAAVAGLEIIPLTTVSQTLKVSGLGGNTGNVVGGSSVGTPWNFGNEDGSTVGSISSDLTSGVLVITISGALSKGSTPTDSVGLRLAFDTVSFGFVVPNNVGPVFLQLTEVSSNLVGAVEFRDISLFQGGQDVGGQYSSQKLGGLVTIGYVAHNLSPPHTSVAVPLNTLISNDTVTDMMWVIQYDVILDVDDSTGTFNETYTLRAVHFVPEPAASLTIPSGIAMLLALSKLRGVSLVH